MSVRVCLGALPVKLGSTLASYQRFAARQGLARAVTRNSVNEAHFRPFLGGGRSIHLTKSSPHQSTVDSHDQVNADALSEEEERKTEETLSRVDAQIADKSYGRLFAVVQMDWHQYKVTAGDLIMTDGDVGVEIGARIKLKKALLVGSKDFTLFGRPLLPTDLFDITATVVEKNLSYTKVSYFKQEKAVVGRHQYRFERSPQTTLRINSIHLLKSVNDTIDRSGFEPALARDPVATN